VIIQSALDRVIRTLVVSIGIGGFLFSVIGILGIIEQWSMVLPAYSVVAIALFSVLPAVMAIIAFRAPVRILRILAGVHAGSTIILIALFVPSMTDPTALYGGNLPWMLNMITLASSEAAIALSFTAAWGYTVFMVLLSGAVRYITFGAVNPSQAIQDSILIAIFSGFMMALIQLTQIAGAQQDKAARSALESATQTAATETVKRQRNQYQNFTRDDVLATLGAAVANTDESRTFARRSAMLALQKMDQLSSDIPVAVKVPIAQLDSQLRAAAVAHGISWASTLSAPDSPLFVPLEVVDAMTEAMTEAMENSIRHGARRGGRVIHRTARASRLPRGVLVIIKDDGRGFNPRRIPLDRLGIRLNILQGMSAQPGAKADIVSSRGRGTTVSLEWNEPTR
jgi:two-component sensor histidine kinase